MGMLEFACGGLLADLQRATISAQAFYAENNEPPKTRSPWILKRLYEWSNRAKRREIIKHVQAALETSVDHELEDDELEKLLPVSWEEMFEGPLMELSSQKQKYLQAVWELFHSELKFLHHQLLVLRNVYKEPLKKCQVEGCLLTVEPDLLFGNLDQLCRISRGFCQTFLNLLQSVNREGTDYDCTDLVVKLFEKFSKGPSTISAYQAYCINYKATMEYLGSIRQKEERFTEFERICLADERCFRLQLEDLLIAPLQRITRLPILLREIHRYTEDPENKAKVEKNLLAHPRRKLIHEGALELVENGRTVDCYAFLFNDMFVLSKTKKCPNKLRVVSFYVMFLAVRSSYRGIRDTKHSDAHSCPEIGEIRSYMEKERMNLDKGD
ncbi:Pleckstrin domain-containing family G member 7 [Trichostrongylus colubriformis]|uniref:Pleckstrin domain-containing family G member 7 n=1 Tax=Trichostrongylus colubriformis TaxID=6319 RepID=A0AAN8IRJ5_TRICO